MSGQLAIHAAALWSGLLILLLIVLSAVTVGRRRRRLVAFGDGGHADVMAASRAFGNATEYVPVGIAALILLAMMAVPTWLIHVLGATLLIGRVVHAYGLIYQTGASLGRVAGMMLTYLMLLVSAVALIAFGVV